MKNKDNQNLVSISMMLATIVAYPISLIFSPLTMPLSGCFLIVIVLLSLKKFKFEIVILLLSPLITYPLFIFGQFFIQFGWGHWIQRIALMIFIYAAIYGYLLRNLWDWVIPNVRKMLMGILIAYAIMLNTIGTLPADCFYISNAEKGVLSSEINMCKFFNLHNPTGASISGKFSGFPEAIGVISTYGPLWIALFIIFTFGFKLATAQKEHSKWSG